MENKPEMNNDVSSVPKMKKSNNQTKKKVEMIIEEDVVFELIIPIPDCFVNQILKLSNGKNGHGERRLYTGDNNNNNEHICKKLWLINYPGNYKKEIEELLDNDETFSKSCDNRKSVVYNAIVRRYYIGPNKNNKENIKLYDTFRAMRILSADFNLFSKNKLKKLSYNYITEWMTQML